MKNKTSQDICVNGKDGNIIPTIELIEYEKETYVKEMQDYLQELKRMNKKDAQRKSLQNLVQSGIIYENGEFTEYYEYTKTIFKNNEE